MITGAARGCDDHRAQESLVPDLGPASMAVHTHDLPPQQAASTLVEQASTALDAGLHGVTISEHRAGFPGYVPHRRWLTRSVLWMSLATRKRSQLVQ